MDSPETNPNALAYRREIDGIRAIAVSAVVLYHAGVGGSGFVGVDVFFVISGYLITALLLRESRAGGIGLVAFYGRRVRRIFPASIVAMAVTLGLSQRLLTPAEFVQVGNSTLASLLFVANYWFQSVTGGYFDGASDQMPLLHLWSLSVEEQFYLFWPALLMLLLRHRMRLTTVLACLALTSFALAETLMRTNPEAAFYQMPARFWELAAGGLIASLPAQPLPRYLLSGGLALTLIACVLPMPEFPASGALPAVLGTCAMIAAIHGGTRSSLLSSAPMVGLGLISYSLYLWHWPLLALYRATSEGTLGGRLALCAVSVLLAVASYRYVEQPLRKPTAMRKVAALGAVCMLLIAAFMAVPARPSAADLAAADKPPSALKCNYGTGDVEFPKSGCESIPGVPAQVALWGDSLALAWQPVAIAIGQRQKMSVTDFSRDDCRPAIGYVAPHHGPPALRCRDWNAKVLAVVARMDTVVLAGRWQHAMEQPEGLPEAMERTLQGLSGVRQVIVIGPSPELSGAVPRCIRTGDWNPCTLPRSRYLADSRAARDMLQALVARHPNARYVDPSTWLCGPEYCLGKKDGIPLYWDSFHPSTTAARAYANGL